MQSFKKTGKTTFVVYVLFLLDSPSLEFVFLSTANASPWPQFPIFLSFLVFLVSQFSYQPCFGNMTCPKLQVFNCLEGRNLFS